MPEQFGLFLCRVCLEGTIVTGIVLYFVGKLQRAISGPIPGLPEE